MKWMRVEMSDAEANGQYQPIQEEFDAAFVAAGTPQEAAMFLSNVTAYENAFYFSPRAASPFSTIIKARGAIPCDAPSRDGVSLLVGNGAPFALLR